MYAPIIFTERWNDIKMLLQFDPKLPIANVQLLRSTNADADWFLSACKNKMTSFSSTEKEAGLEATTGFEPVNGGFADLCLTTWLRRPSRDSSILASGCQSG